MRGKQIDKKQKHTNSKKTKQNRGIIIFKKIINGYFLSNCKKISHSMFFFFLACLRVFEKMSGAPNSSPRQKTPENLECFKVGGLFRFATFRI